MVIACWGVSDFLPKMATNELNPKNAFIYETFGRVIPGLLFFVFMLVNNKIPILKTLNDMLVKIPILKTLDGKYIIISIISVVFLGISLLIYITIQNKIVSKGVWIAVVGGIIGSMGMLSFFMAAKYGSISKVVMVTALYPIFTMLLGWRVLGENMNRQHWTAFFVAILAIVLMMTADNKNKKEIVESEETEVVLKSKNSINKE